MDVVNIVGSGSLDIELDLSQLVADLDPAIADYDPDKYPGIYLRFDDDAPLITIYRTGKNIVTGGESEEGTYSYRDRFLTLLSEMGVMTESSDIDFAIQNYVLVADLEQIQNLEVLAIGLVRDAQYRILELEEQLELHKDSIEECPELNGQNRERLERFCVFREEDGYCTELQKPCVLPHD